MATTTNVSNLKINILTPEQYEAATKDASQLYIIGNDTDYLTTATKEYIDTVASGKVDIISGKGLSTNDYTTDEKNKLAGIAEGATANTGTITAVQANGTDVATSGTANIPAASTSAYGVTKLSSDTNSTSTELAATASAVKTAYDLANGAMPKSGGTFTGATYAQANTSYTTYQLRNIALSTSAATPTGNGAILGVYA